MRTIKPVGKGIQSDEILVAQITVAQEHGHCPPQSPSRMMGYHRACCSTWEFSPLPRLWPLAYPQISQFWQGSQGGQSRQDIPASYAQAEPLCNSTNMYSLCHYKRTSWNSAQGLCHCPCDSSRGRGGGEVAAPQPCSQLRKLNFWDQQRPHHRVAPTGHHQAPAFSGILIPGFPGRDFCKIPGSRDFSGRD